MRLILGTQESREGGTTREAQVEDAQVGEKEADKGHHKQTMICISLGATPPSPYSLDLLSFPQCVVEPFIRLDCDYIATPTLCSYFFLPRKSIKKDSRKHFRGRWIWCPSVLRARRSSVRNASPTSVRHHLDVLVQSTLIDLEWVRFPLLASLLQLILGNTELDDVLHRVNVDNVSIHY